jgi:hypothetical protein
MYRKKKNVQLFCFFFHWDKAEYKQESFPSQSVILQLQNNVLTASDHRCPPSRLGIIFQRAKSVFQERSFHGKDG